MKTPREIAEEVARDRAWHIQDTARNFDSRLPAYAYEALTRALADACEAAIRAYVAERKENAEN